MQTFKKPKSKATNKSSNKDDFIIIIIIIIITTIKTAGDKLLMNRFIRQNFGGGLTLKKVL